MEMGKYSTVAYGMEGCKQSAVKAFFGFAELWLRCLTENFHRYSGCIFRGTNGGSWTQLLARV